MSFVASSFLRTHSNETARAKWEEGMVDGRSVCSESAGLHAAYNGWDNGLRLRKEELILKLNPSPDRGLQPALVKPKSLVVACHHPATNEFLLLAHTARQAIRVDLWRAFGSCQNRVTVLWGGLSRKTKRWAIWVLIDIQYIDRCNELFMCIRC